MKKCPYCAEQVQDEAILCRYCGKEIVRHPGESALRRVSWQLADNRKRSILFALVMVAATTTVLLGIGMYRSYLYSSDLYVQRATELARQRASSNVYRIESQIQDSLARQMDLVRLMSGWTPAVSYAFTQDWSGTYEGRDRYRVSMKPKVTLVSCAESRSTCEGAKSWETGTAIREFLCTAEFEVLLDSSTVIPKNACAQGYTR